MHRTSRGQALAIVFEHAFLEALERHLFEIPGRDDSIGIDIVSPERHRPPAHLINRS
jgi:hypothetical protein